MAPKAQKRAQSIVVDAKKKQLKMAHGKSSESVAQERLLIFATSDRHNFSYMLAKHLSRLTL
jgi:hypothetical protein